MKPVVFWRDPRGACSRSAPAHLLLTHPGASARGIAELTELGRTVFVLEIVADGDDLDIRVIKHKGVNDVTE
jgi:hypothetical protein